MQNLHTPGDICNGRLLLYQILHSISENKVSGYISYLQWWKTHGSFYKTTLKIQDIQYNSDKNGTNEMSNFYTILFLLNKIEVLHRAIFHN